MAKNGSSARDVSPVQRRELEVAAAVARDATAQLHATRALHMIDLAQGQVSAVRMLGIYLRLLGLQQADAATVSNRALASLGRRETNGAQPSLYVEGEAEWKEEGFSFVTVVRDRLRGRVNHGLRRQVELHAGATQIALLELHVRHALEVVSKLQDSLSISHACSLYADMTSVPEPLRQMLYMTVLSKLAELELPKQSSRLRRIGKAKESVQ